ncbi:9592_t:CDS:1, partial [Acaulospora colombiana]
SDEYACENGTFICEIITYESEKHGSLVASVKPVAGNFSERPLEPQTVLGLASRAEDLYGGEMMFISITLPSSKIVS